MDHDLTTEVDLDLTDPAVPVDLHDDAIRAEVEAALGSVPGVLASRLVPGYDRPVDELHVLSGLDKSPKQIVRDICSMLMAKYGLTIDHRVVSVVQLDEDEAVADGRRVVISRVAVEQRGLAVEVHVNLTTSDRELEGSSEGPSSTAGRRRTAARATLEAVRPLLGQHRVVEVEGADVPEVLGREVAISLVHFHTVKGDYTVCGSAMVRNDEHEAIARSVLDAVNRSVDAEL